MIATLGFKLYPKAQFFHQILRPNSSRYNRVAAFESTLVGIYVRYIPIRFMEILNFGLNELTTIFYKNTKQL